MPHRGMRGQASIGQKESRKAMCWQRHGAAGSPTTYISLLWHQQQLHPRSHTEPPHSQPSSPTRTTGLSQAPRRADSKKMLAADVTELSESLFILWHFLLSILRQESHRSGLHVPPQSPSKPELVPSSRSSQLLLLKTLSPNS